MMRRAVREYEASVMVPSAPMAMRTGNTPVTFTVALKQAPLKVSLDPNYAVLRR